MPKVAFEVCQRIKADPATAAIPVLHLSATFADSESRSQGLEGGADGYLTGFEEKPKIPYCVSMGVYCVNKKVLDLIPEGDSFGFDQLMLKMIADRQRVRTVVHEGYWLDIGRPDDYQKALEDWPKLRTKLKGWR